MPLPARPLPPSVMEALQRGNKIEAIKRLRKLEGIGLKEAKDAVEAAEGVASALGVDRSPGEVPAAGGRLWLVVVVALGALLAWLLMR